MRRQLVIGNWKMNGSSASNTALLSALQAGLGETDASLATIAVCVPSVYLSAVKTQVQNSPIKVGAQNLSQYEQGAYTGEVSASMLAELNTDYVLVGHSERRSLFGESSEVVAEKFEAALKSGLTPILCVGETLEEREAGKTMSVVSAQLKAVIDRVALNEETQYIIAYEPVWAIGTGLTATPEQAQDVHRGIRDLLQNSVSQACADRVAILYGGSVSAASAQALFAQADIDGGLVGGASLKAEDFLAIWRAASNT